MEMHENETGTALVDYAFSFSPKQLIVYRYRVNVERAKYILWAAEMPRAVSFYRSAFNASILRQSEVLSELEIAGATIGIHAGGEGERTWTGLSFSSGRCRCRSARSRRGRWPAPQRTDV